MLNTLKKLFNFVNYAKFISTEEKILKIFASVPKLPVGVIDFIVSFGPYLVLVGGILGILSVLTLLSVTVIPFVPIYFVYLNVISAFITGVASVTSFSELQKRSLFGWRLIFWSGNLAIIVSLISLNIIGAVLSALISWYILSQIKSKYS